ncbi:hypothetical protein [Corynebacterium aquatimens]|uniref:Secreted protein n=1 Tax=Corynebacterium aquatimens TaxID=1190508 RepID=A0A931E2W1_9CORY|nr:hypothetical protein [Corynebacterium aquatimens]MBG6121503.1 hypothetical protein [Corynebacterium aquatimens]WJY65954.1 hypothetical protein CAQUA_06245 [Corynebacterium aquatimens]
MRKYRISAVTAVALSTSLVVAPAYAQRDVVDPISDPVEAEDPRETSPTDTVAATATVHAQGDLCFAEVKPENFKLAFKSRLVKEGFDNTKAEKYASDSKYPVDPDPAITSAARSVIVAFAKKESVQTGHWENQKADIQKQYKDYKEQLTFSKGAGANQDAEAARPGTPEQADEQNAKLHILKFAVDLHDQVDADMKKCVNSAAQGTPSTGTPESPSTGTPSQGETSSLPKSAQIALGVIAALVALLGIGALLLPQIKHMLPFNI